MPADQATLDFLEAAKAQGGAGPISVAEFRAAAERFGELGFEHEEVALVEELEIPRAEAKSISATLYRPALSGPLPVIVWAHGGSWVRVRVALLDSHYRVLANRSGCAVLAVDYGLAPESRFPTAIEEIQACLAWIGPNADSLDLDPERIAIGGESSGANLAAATALLNRERGGVDLALQALICPILDLSFESASWRALGGKYLLTPGQVEWALSLYAPEVGRDNPLLAPLRAPSQAGLPPALIVIGELDPLKDDGAGYAAALRDAGVAAELTEVAGMIHHAVAAPKLLPTGRDMFIEFAAKTGDVLRGEPGDRGSRT